METSTTGNAKSSIGALFLALVFLLVPVAAFLFWTQRTLPPPVSAHGGGIDAMLNYLLLTVGLLLVAGHVVLAWFVWKFSRQERATVGVVGARTEWKWALVPVVAMSLVAEGGVLMIGLPVWKQLHVTDPPADTVLVEVTAQQFAWYFRYPGRDGVFGRTDVKYMTATDQVGVDPKDKAGQDDLVEAVLRVPVGRLIHLRMRSKDVIHSFFVPQLRLKQDIVPGMMIDAYFTPTATGKYEILCTELCGLGHYRMRGVLEVLEPAAYEKWLKQAEEELAE